jgi:hypothetical protein
LKANVWTNLTEYAGKVFWNMSKKNHYNKKVLELIGQMANFKCKEGYYSASYTPSHANPKIWWQVIENSNDHLKNLAIKIFSITPHSASCERVFSTLGFLYGKRRQCLSLTTIELIAKVRHYLLSNIKNELNFKTKNKTEAEMETLIKECGLFSEENEDEDDIDDNNIFDNNELVNEEELVIPTNEVYILIINDMVNINHTVFTGESEENILENDSENEDESEEEFDISKINNISAPF